MYVKKRAIELNSFCDGKWLWQDPEVEMGM